MNKFEKYKKGQIIFREGERQDWLYEIFYGVVGIYSDYNTPKERLLTSVYENAFFE